MKLQRIGAVLLVVALPAIGACSDVVGPGAADTYELAEAQGQPLPAVVFEGDTEFGVMRATAVSGSITLRESTFTERVVFDIEVDGTSFGEDLIVVNGDYTADGALLTFDPEQAGSPTFTGTLTGNTLTTVEEDPQFGTLTLTWQR